MPRVEGALVLRRQLFERSIGVVAEQCVLASALVTFDEPWSPRIIGRYNGNKIFLSKAKGEFVWHSHDDTDDLFLVLEGRLTISCATATSLSARGTLCRPALCRAPPAVGRGRLDPAHRARRDAQHRRSRDSRGGGRALDSQARIGAHA